MKECPICKKVLSPKGLWFHVSNNHPKELKKMGWKKIKNQVREVEGKKSFTIDAKNPTEINITINIR